MVPFFPTVGSYLSTVGARVCEQEKFPSLHGFLLNYRACFCRATFLYPFIFCQKFAIKFVFRDSICSSLSAPFGLTSFHLRLSSFDPVALKIKHCIMTARGSGTSKCFWACKNCPPFMRISVCKQLDNPRSGDQRVTTNNMKSPVEINRGKLKDCERLLFLLFSASLRVAPAVPTLKAEGEKSKMREKRS